MEVTRVHDAVYRITTPFGAGDVAFLYLVRGESVALIDTGAADSPKRVLEPALRELGMALSDVDLILNTHVHVDHSGGNMEVKKASGAPIHVHRDDAERARSSDANLRYALAPFLALEFPPEMLRRREEFARKLSGEPAGVDVVLEDGDVVDLGGGIRLKVVHTPGHTPGCVSYYWESEGMLFTGDGVQGQGSEAGKYPFYFKAGDYRRTLSALQRMGFRLLCMSHSFIGGGVINEPTRKGEDVQAFLRECVRVADTLQWAVERAVQRLPGAARREVVLAALTDLVYDVPQLLVRETGMPWFGGPTLLSHVESVMAGDYPVGA